MATWHGPTLEAKASRVQHILSSVLRDYYSLWDRIKAGKDITDLILQEAGCGRDENAARELRRALININTAFANVERQMREANRKT